MKLTITLTDERGDSRESHTIGAPEARQVINAIRDGAHTISLSTNAPERRSLEEQRAARRATELLEAITAACADVDEAETA